MTTNILWNGSKWAGQEPDPLPVLLQRLAETPLHPMFEEYGDFVQFTTDGGCRFWGNFWLISAAFCIETDDPDTVSALADAIRENRASLAFKEARDEYRADEAQKAARFSFASRRKP
jgi:hypothetical protein